MEVNEIIYYYALFTSPQKTQPKSTDIHSTPGFEPFNLIKKIVSNLRDLFNINNH